MKKSILFLLFVSFTSLYCQEVPLVQLNDSTQLKLSELNVDVKIIGNFATTTYDMKFYNGLDRTMEGELLFPLGQGQVVSGFEMDVNGEMRDAVIVEKELARVAYENTVRQTIDPGLLEKTQGNNYKARIYPILPKDYKHIKITYEEELSNINNLKVYELPLGFTDNLDEFSIDIDIYGDKKPLEDELVFLKKATKYQATLFKKEYTPNAPIVIKIPNDLGSRQVVSSGNYFYINQQLKPNFRIKRKPRKISVLWDASFSAKHRKIQKELELLELYFEYLEDIEVQFISFNNSVDINRMFKITNGNWSALKNEIENITYDGGTSLCFFDTMKLKSNEILLFTDGLTNLGDFTKKIEKSIYTINTSVSGDHQLMDDIATSSGGSYINLTRYDSKNALNILKRETYQFLGIVENPLLNEVYPNQNTNVLSDFSVTGKFLENTTIKLLFGYQNKVTKEIEIPITNSAEDDVVKRLWAKEKLISLNRNKKENKRKIISLAKQYQLITDYTSMLILDRIEDYVRYRIEPPQELKAAYKERIANIKEEETYKKEEIAERRIELFEEYEDLLSWYTTKFPKKQIKKRGQANAVNENNTSSPQNTGIVTTERQTNGIVNNAVAPIESSAFALDSTKGIVSGVVTDQRGEPLPGVNIVVKGTTNGTQTDFDGNFAINAEIEQELEISYIGFRSTNLVVNNLSMLNLRLEEDASMLEEVVVTGYGTEKRKSITGSVTTVTTESFSGAVAGVHFDRVQAGANSSVVIRGVSSSITDSEPLYIVDGVPVQGNPTDQLLPDDIESIQVLKEESGAALYGARGQNGVLVITTREGKEKNSEKIEELNQKISNEIELKSWNPDTPYLKTLAKEKTIESAYTKYLEIRSQYANIPSFYLDVADFFDKKGATGIAIRIVTNLMEVDLDNHELMRALAYKLEYFKQYELAVIVYKKVLELRPEEPQSYRDLALVYESIGEFQKSFDLLYKIYNGELLEKDEDERFFGIEQLAYVELNRLVYKHERKLKLSKSLKKKFNKTPVDIRIVIDWNHNDTDIDLWVIDPKEEKGYYSNSETEIGGRLSEDMTEGYGPEEFMLKDAIRGRYKVMIDYYADNVQKISGPTILKVTMFTNYGKKNESKKISIVRLDKQEEEIEVGSLKF